RFSLRRLHFARLQSPPIDQGTNRRIGSRGRPTCSTVAGVSQSRTEKTSPSAPSALLPSEFFTRKSVIVPGVCVGENGPSQRQVHSSANALFHALPRGRWHARGLFAWVSRFARLRSHAGRNGDWLL